MVQNTPVLSRPVMKADLGNLRAGLGTLRRIDAELRPAGGNTQRVQYRAQDAGVGRFVPARHFDEVHVPCRTKDLS